jgi:hypothetical protein
MAYTSAGFTDTQDNQKSFNEKYIDNDPGPYIATVKITNDPLKMGRLGVNIPALSQTTNPTASQIIWCQYLSPFYGAKSINAVSEIDPYLYKETQHSYGMWAVPPDVDTDVLVIFAKGEQSNASAFWIGCVQKPLVNQQVPGNGASVNTSKAAEAQEASETSKLEDYGTEFLPAGEKNQRLYAPGEILQNIDKWKYPVNDVLADQLKKQGLVQDTVRGTTSSSARRESPSRVFGINTPGRIRSDSRELNIGLDNTKVQTDRDPGHSFVMDDGAADGTNQLTRLRTASGHQLLLNDSEGVVYLANGSGKAFIEMDTDGTISVYSDGGINMRTGRDFNLHSDMNINFHAKGAINFTSETNLALNAEGYVFAMGEKGILNSSHKGSVRNYARDGISSFTDGTQLHGAGGRIDLAGSQVHFNSVGASETWGPKWLKADAVGIKVTNGLIDIDDDKPFRGPKSIGVDKFGNDIKERGLQVNKIPNKTTVTDFVTHEPYDRQSSTARKKKFINEAIEEIKKTSPNLSSEELKVIKQELLKQPSIKAVADKLGKVVKLNDNIKLPLKNLNGLISQANDIQKLIEDPKGAVMNFIHGQIASIKNQALDFFKSKFKF